MASPGSWLMSVSRWRYLQP